MHPFPCRKLEMTTPLHGLSQQLMNLYSLYGQERKTSSSEVLEEHIDNYLQGFVQTGKALGFNTCAHS